ncbi:DDB1- and CUL4-associated factor 10-like [Penaeus chinensis]|uniref:DDB1- and CUL4-associated factor 10-like n=1 Tax=Penaeus chinensis TaxID=139456 RepID=UPI001FB80B61|nr:DDB1- and CUL4-associated factor 10-like [Penaeus chinensis]
MPKVKTGRIHGSYFPDYELRRRETGLGKTLGWDSGIRRSLYSSMIPSTFWDPIEHDPKTGFTGHGGVFNLEFSPDGTYLVAACEQRAIMVFDPLSRRQIHYIPLAHENCVNGIKFLDSRVFASCSDDHTVALWDVRNLKRRIRLLQGHSNWVKNIEYSAGDGILVTSGFDGKILGWDINGYTEDGLLSTELFSMQGLMRMRLSPDCSKLVMCTTGGYMVLVHNLSLEHLSEDLRNFKPNMYRLMQLSNTPLPHATMFTNLFYRQRNRVEFISDFPPSNEAEVIHSLQVHPQGWCVLSRNTSMEDSSEWSCVHDIQDLGVTACKDEDEDQDHHGDIEPYDDIPSTSETEAQNSSTFQNRPSSVNSSNNNSNSSTNSGSESGNVNGNLHLSLTFSPRVEIMLRHSPRDESDDGGGDGGGGGGGELAGGAGPARSGSSGSNVNAFATASGGSGVRVVDGAGIAVGGSAGGGGGGGGGIDIQLRFTSMDVFEALEHIRERREEQRIRQGRQRAARTDSEASSSSGNNENSSGFPQSSSSQSPSPALQHLGRNRTFSVHRGRDFDNARENLGSGRTAANIIDSRNAFYIRTGTGNHRALLLLRPLENYPRYNQTVDPNHKIAKNISRLTHYIEEPNVGRGFIKELCFNSDGRLICSPYAHGVRLMMFDQNCSELSTCVQDIPQTLYAVSTNNCHKNCVVSTKFSPTHCLLVSGCLNGKIVWHQPVL